MGGWVRGTTALDLRHYDIIFAIYKKYPRKNYPYIITQQRIINIVSVKKKKTAPVLDLSIALLAVVRFVLCPPEFSRYAPIIRSRFEKMLALRSLRMHTFTQGTSRIWYESGMIFFASLSLNSICRICKVKRHIGGDLTTKLLLFFSFVCLQIVRQPTSDHCVCSRFKLYGGLSALETKKSRTHTQERPPPHAPENGMKNPEHLHPRVAFLPPPLWHLHYLSTCPNRSCSQRTPNNGWETPSSSAGGRNTTTRD